MAEFSFDASFNEDEYKFYSDHEYEEFLTNIKKNLQLLDSKSDQALPDSCSKSSSYTETKSLCDTKAENWFNVLGKDSSNVITDNVYNTKAENSSTTDAKNTNLIVADAEFENFLNLMNNRLETNNVETSQVLQPRNSLPRSQSLSCETDSTDQPIHARSQSTSRIPEFNLTKAKAQAEHDFMSKRKFYAEQMYQFFNKKVFNNKLPETVLLKWNGQMKSTAGFCKCQRINNEYSFHIELSPNVLTSFDRLQDTLIHEMCHAACWMVNHSRDHHGQLWKTWADRCNLILPEIKVPTTCHSYELSYAYLLKCTSCAFERKRHKMCEKLQRTTCPLCKAPTELIIN